MTIRGVVAASEPNTAEAGARLLREGGNAVDAIVAAKLAATVVELPLTSLGGGGACVWGHPRTGFRVLDFFSSVPGLGVERPATLDFHPITVDFGPTRQTYHVGRAAAAVPGELEGLLALHEAGGRLPLSAVVAPAVSLARDGFAVSPQISMILGMLAPIGRVSEAVSRAFLPTGEVPAPGDRLSNPELGDFLHGLGAGRAAELVQQARALLVTGFGPERGGMISAEDIAAWRPVDREPLAIPIGDFVVLTNPPPSAGGGLIGAGLRIAAELGLGKEPYLSRAYVEAVAAVLAAVSDLRGSGYDERLRTDPDGIRALVGGPGAIGPFTAIARGIRAERSLGGTTQVSVLDADGNAASMTTSNGEGCGHALPGLGIHVNNFLGEEDINPAGFHQSPPGQRMSTMMSPTVVLRDGEPIAVLGTGGSNRIRSAILQTLLGHLVYGQPLARAVSAPRLHVEGRQLWFEDADLGPGASASLLAGWPGAARFEQRSMFFGGVHCVGRTSEGLYGAADARRGGVVR
jgi:gamma-glutamyltranspeptidase/glutathione hydrolase